MADTSDTKPDVATGRFGKRHIVALVSFIVCSLLLVHRLVIGVAIVAMVKHKHVSETVGLNSTEISCPLVIKSQNSTKYLLNGQLDWSTELQGYVLGASFFGFIFTQLAGGRWAESWGGKNTALVGNILAGVFSFLTPMASWWNVYAVIAVQFLRGLAQGVCTPGIFVFISKWFPRSERGFLSTFTVSGFAIGGTFGGVITGWLCDQPQLGWESAFYLSGVATALISIIFMFVLYENPRDHPSISKEELKHITEGQESDLSSERPPPPWRKILTSVPVYALSVGLFGHFWSVSYFFSVHPTYMGTVLHYSMTENGAVSSIPVAFKSVGGIIACFFTNWITKNNYIGVDKLRKATNTVGTLGFCLCLLGAYWAGCDHTINLVCFSLSLFTSGFALSGAMIASVDMSPRYSGTLMGLGSTFASLSTFIIPVMVGFLTENQTIEEWHNVFFISIATVALCGLTFILFGSAEVQPWNKPETTTKSSTNSDYDNKQFYDTKF